MQDNGIILVNKPKGMTSHDVVAITRRFFRSQGNKKHKVGHAGTLDPMAEGVLPVCCGRATKFVDFLADGRKQYRATLQLGIITDTQDTTGGIIEKKPVSCSKEQILEVIKEFVGDIKQIPPMYSAIKQNGKKLYELARKGIEVERPARDITIYGIKILAITGDSVEMLVDCSKGTYIRTLCHDIGDKLGCGGAMSALVRTKVGSFPLENCVDMDSLERGEFEFVKTAVCIGTFDGVHIAHQELLKLTAGEGLCTCALVIEPEDGSGSRIISVDEKIEKLRKFGVDMVINVPLNKVKTLAPEEFFEEYIINRLNAAKVVVGFDFRFGRGRMGDVNNLAELCDKNDVKLAVLQPHQANGKVVSSTLIRELLLDGKELEARKML